MARSKRRREVSTPTPSLTVRLPSVSRSLVSVRTVLQEVEDRRTFHPLGRSRPARFSTGGPSHVSLKDRSRNGRYKYSDPFGASGTKAFVAFQRPGAVAICVRRKTRKEVLFAKREAGRRGGFKRRFRRGPWSKISCR